MVRRKRSTLEKLLPDWLSHYIHRRPMNRYDPTRTKDMHKEAARTVYTLFRYNKDSYEEKVLTHEESCALYRKHDDSVMWLNIDGLKREDIERICKCYDIHFLIMEDILSVGQRAKMDETGSHIFCLLPMLYYNERTGTVETEQVSIVLGSNFVLSFQEDDSRDVFNPIRERIRSSLAKLRESGADYLCYSLIDVIVDSYFSIIDKLNDRIERLEDDLLMQKDDTALPKISILRREVMMMRRSVLPVRDVVNGFVRTDNKLIQDWNTKYYKDILDHIIQANDYIENHRDMMMNLQDLSVSQINLRMNQVMKVFTLLATLMAPATVIGGIFGMNFDIIPLAHQTEGFYIAVAVMLLIPVFMLIFFKRKGWF